MKTVPPYIVGFSMKPSKEDVEFVQFLKKKKIPRQEVADMIYGISLVELEAIKERRNCRLQAIKEVYDK